ncbi:MAG: hypothetical protein AAFN93_12620 [Bacteroidota bacterium]
MSNIQISWTRRTSYLSKAISKYVGVNLSKLIPKGVSVLSLILFSNLLVWLALFFTIQADNVGYFALAITSSLLVFHLLLGFTSQFISSKNNTPKKAIITAFIDHYLTAFNIGIIILIVTLSFNIQSAVLLALLTVSVFLSSMATYYKQFKTGQLNFSSFGYTEGVMFGIIILSLSTLTVFKEGVINGTLFSLPVYEILIMSLSLLILISFIRVLKGIPNMRYSVWMFAILFSLTGAMGSQLFSHEGTVILLSLYACLYISKILTGHFIDGIERSPGLFTPLFILIIYFVPELFDLNTLLIVLIYLLVNNILQIYRFIKTVMTLEI